MADINKDRQKLVSEVEALRQRVAELEKQETEYKRIAEGVLKQARDELAERIKAETRLKESEEKFSTIVENFDDVIFHLSPRGFVQYVSPNVEEMYGYKVEDLIGKHLKKTTPLREVPKAVRALRTVLSGKAVKNFEIHQIDGKGNIILKEINLAPIVKDDRVIAVQGVMRDVTERKQAEAKLRESEERYRTIFDSANDILVLISKRGKILDINERTRDYSGYAREKLIGKNISALSKVITRKSLATITKNLLKRMAGARVPPYEVELIKSDGELIDAEISAVAVRKEGKIVGDLAILRDITERKQAEHELIAQKQLIDRILANMPNAVLVINKDHQIMLANEAFYRTFRMRRNQVQGKPINQVIPVADLPRTIAKVLVDKERQLQFEFRQEIDNRKLVLAAIMLPMGEGEALLLINDITSERERQERLYLTDRLASVGEMVAGVAHELNNPLTSVIGFSQLIIDESIPDNIRKDVKTIYSEAQRAASIVRNLLTFARKHAPVREPVPINRVIEDVLNLRAHEHGLSNIHVETRFDPELPAVMADYFQMQQVFLNIILNAESAMLEAHNQGMLTITTKRSNGNIRVSFIDDGPGIPEDSLSRLFDPFFTTKEVGKGTGLGLSICYGIVSEHDGKIYAHNEPGKGASFAVELPVMPNK